MEGKEIPFEEECQRRAAKRWHAYKCIALVFVISSLFLLKHFMLMPAARKTDMTHAISNAKYVHSIMLEFEADYGHFPDDVSATQNSTLNGFVGNYSNDYFGQLIAGGYITTEESFYAKDKRYRKGVGDNVIAPDSKILEKHECGLSYVMVEENGKRRGLSSKDHSHIPVLVSPLANQWGSCEKISYNMRGVYIRVDGSARSQRLRETDQKIQIGRGKTLFDTGPDTVWGDLKPVILLPER